MEPLVATSGLVGDLGTGVPIEQVSSLEHDGRLSKKHKLNLLPQVAFTYYNDTVLLSLFLLLKWNKYTIEYFLFQWFLYSVKLA